MPLYDSFPAARSDGYHPLRSCLIVKTDIYDSNQISKVLQLRANIEGLRLGPGVIERLVQEGDARSLRHVLQLLTPASILASLAGRAQIELEDVSELDELFYDAKTSAMLNTR
jgi:RuvB-like protein 1 (pontin 52)